MAKANLNELLRDALTRKDARKAGKLSDAMRFQLGMNYADQVKRVESLGFRAETWENLMYEADYYSE